LGLRHGCFRHVILRGVTPEQYDLDPVREWLKRRPGGGYSHVAWWEGGDNHNIDARESEAAFDAFGQDRLGPAMGKLGIDVAPEVTFLSGT